MIDIPGLDKFIEETIDETAPILTATSTDGEEAEFYYRIDNWSFLVKSKNGATWADSILIQFPELFLEIYPNEENVIFVSEGCGESYTTVNKQDSPREFKQLLKLLRLDMLEIQLSYLGGDF